MMLTKSQTKKLAKRERIQAKYAARKEEAKKQKPEELTSTSSEEPPNPLRQERSAMIRAEFESNAERGPIVVIDCEWDNKMTDKELLSLTQQIMYSYACNKKAKRPVRLCILGVSPPHLQLIQKLPGFSQWYITVTSHTLKELNLDGNVTYLTADTEDVLDISQVTPNDVLIVGGIVDRNRFKNATANRAQELGLRTAQLPIGQYMQMKSSKVLTVNHVVEILTEVLDHGDWGEALNKVIPGRKKDLE